MEDHSRILDRRFCLRLELLALGIVCHYAALPTRGQGVRIEAESLFPGASATGGALCLVPDRYNMGMSGGMILSYAPPKASHILSLPLESPATNGYRMILMPLYGPAQGEYQIAVDDAPPFSRLYSFSERPHLNPAAAQTTPIPVFLSRGLHQLRFQCVNKVAEGRLLGLDWIRLDAAPAETCMFECERMESVETQGLRCGIADAACSGWAALRLSGQMPPSVTFSVKTTEEGELQMLLTTVRTHEGGAVQVRWDGSVVGHPVPTRAVTANTDTSPPLPSQRDINIFLLGKVAAGEHRVTFSVIESPRGASGYVAVLDCFSLSPKGKYEGGALKVFRCDSPQTVHYGTWGIEPLARPFGSPASYASFSTNQVGGGVEFDIPVAESGVYEISLHSWKHSVIYGVYQTEVDGQTLGEPYNGHPDSDTPVEPVLGRMSLAAGIHRFRFTFVGRPKPDMAEGQGQSLVLRAIVLQRVD